MSNEKEITIEEQVAPHIVGAKFALQKSLLEIVVTSIFLIGALVCYFLGICSLIAVFVILFGAIWNFFTSSNKFFACIGAFLVCVPYAYLAVNYGLYGQAFLHILFYIPIQLIYYYQSKKEEDISILKTKELGFNAVLGTTITSLMLATGLALILYRIGESFYLLDAISVILLIVSVFLVNGRYKDYYLVRLVGVSVSAFMWLYYCIMFGFKTGALGLSLLFVMYLTMDTIKCINFYRKR